MAVVDINLQLVKEFGIDLENAFAFWDWVGGHYNVCRVVDILPLSFQYGLSNINKLLDCALSLDRHFHTASFEKNIVVLLSLLNVWNVSFLGNGKGVPVDGMPLSYEASEIDFGKLGTNGQHIYQLIHQGQIIPGDSIGVIKSQQPVYLKQEVVSNHDKLMCNFFAQSDVLTYGKTPKELRNKKVADRFKDSTELEEATRVVKGRPGASVVASGPSRARAPGGHFPALLQRLAQACSGCQREGPRDGAAWRHRGTSPRRHFVFHSGGPSPMRGAGPQDLAKWRDFGSLLPVGGEVSHFPFRLGPEPQGSCGSFYHWGGPLPSSGTGPRDPASWRDLKGLPPARGRDLPPSLAFGHRLRGPCEAAVGESLAAFFILSSFCKARRKEPATPPVHTTRKNNLATFAIFAAFGRLHDGLEEQPRRRVYLCCNCCGLERETG
eukprot:Gb_00382 [translate_table: standard]